MPEIASSPGMRIARGDSGGILDRLEDAVILLDHGWRVRFVNRSAEQLMGKGADALLDRVLWEEVPVLCGVHFESECRRSVEERQPREFEEYDASRDRWLEQRLVPSEEGLTIQIRDVTQRQRAKIAQEDRERWYSTLVNSVGGIMWVADAETFQFSFVSKQAEKVLGYPVERWLKEPEFWRNHIHPDDLGWCTKICFEASARGHDHAFEYRMIAADGRVVWLRDVVSVKMEDGVMRLRGIMLDITEQKQADERLHRKEAYFRRLVEDAWDSFGLVTEDGTVLYVSPSIERMLGYSPAEMVGKRGIEWVHPEDAEQIRTFLSEVFATEKVRPRAEYRSQHKDGSWHTLEAVGKRITDEQGRTVAIVNIRDITDRSRIEKQLRESEARFRLLFEKNAAGMSISNTNYQYLQVNPAFCRMLGYSEHELLRKTISDVTHPDDLPETHRQVEEVIAGKRQVIDVEKRYVRKDGGVVWGHTTAIYLLPEKKPIYGIATVQDITDRKRVAEALSVSEERYRSLVLASSQVVWVTTASGEVTPGQPSWGSLTGQREEEILGWGWLDAVHPDDRPRVLRVWEHALEQKTYYQSECRIRTATGEYRDFALRGVPVFNPNGGVREWVGTCTDITEQKRAAADIVEWKDRYEAAVSASGQLLYDWNPSTNELTFGEGLQGMLGYTHAEMVGGISPWIELIHPDDRATFRRALDRVERTQEPFHMEYRVRHKDGSYRVVNDEGRFYPHVSDTSSSMIGFVSDITERKNALLQLASAKEAAEAANRAKDDFLAALSHELRTPLNPVLMLASEQEHSADLPASARQDFAMIRKNVELEARIIDDLLDLTRVTRGKVQLKLRTVDAPTLIRQAIDVIRAELDAKQLALVMDLSAPEQRVRGDSVRLQQIFWNVLKNAVKFTPPGGRVTLRSRNTAGHKLLLEFSDTGVGIPSEDLAHIFEPFVQGATSGHQFGGLGLGLTITKRLVELQDGRIWAESAGRGSGSTFYIELPLAPVEAADRRAAPSATPRRTPTPTGARILLVEDHEPTRVTLARLLTRQGYQVSSADSVAGARDLAAHNEFDLVTSDIGLPDGSGHELMAELRDEYGLTGIALSGYGMEEDIQRSLASGFAAHLTKPVDMQSLQAAITDVEKHAHPVG